MWQVDGEMACEIHGLAVNIDVSMRVSSAHLEISLGVMGIELLGTPSSVEALSSHVCASLAIDKQ